MLINLWKRGRWLILPVLLILPWSASAAEFSAQMMLKDGAKVMPGKIFVKDDKMRQEFLDEEGRSITIVRRDKKVVWIVMPQDRTYMEMPLRLRLPGQFLQMPPDAVQKRKVGQESVNGYETEKYEIAVRGGKTGLLRQTVWMCPKLGMPVKMVCRERNSSLEYRSIREGKQADSLFEPPTGYQKLTQPSGLPLKRWE